MFNKMNQLYIGGQLSKSGAMTAPFRGLISGLSFNSRSTLNFAKSNHPSITIQGDARIADLGNRSVACQQLYICWCAP